MQLGLCQGRRAAALLCYMLVPERVCGAVVSCLDGAWQQGSAGSRLHEAAEPRSPATLPPPCPAAGGRESCLPAAAEL